MMLGRGLAAQTMQVVASRQVKTLRACFMISIGPWDKLHGSSRLLLRNKLQFGSFTLVKDRHADVLSRQTLRVCHWRQIGLSNGSFGMSKRRPSECSIKRRSRAKRFWPSWVKTAFARLAALPNKCGAKLVPSIFTSAGSRAPPISASVGSTSHS